MFENVDVSLIIAGAAFVSSVISPIIVAIINNWHIRRMYVLQKRDSEKRAAVCDFIETLAAYINSPDGVSRKDFDRLNRITGKMYLYIPRRNWKYLDIVSHYALTQEGYEKVENGYCSFCKSLASRY